MKNEVSEQVKAEIWTETGLDSITGYWGSYTIFAVNNPLAPLRNHVAASTHAGLTTRLKTERADIVIDNRISGGLIRASFTLLGSSAPNRPAA